MASVQVLSNSTNNQTTRKQDLLEAGKRRLEEFRKKKAADRARKAASTGQNQSVDDDKPGALENEQGRLSNAGDASMSSELGHTGNETSGVVDAERPYGFPLANELKPTNNIQADASRSNTATFSSALPKAGTDLGHPGAPSTLTNDSNANYKQHSVEKVDGPGSDIGEKRYMDGVLSDKSVTLYPNVSSQDYSMYNTPAYFGLERSLAKENNGLADNSLSVNSHVPDVADNTSRPWFGSTWLQNRTDSIYSSSDSQVTAPEFERSSAKKDSHVISGVGLRKPGNYSDNLSIYSNEPIPVAKPPSLGINLDVGGSFSHTALSSSATEAQPRRSRPSFLDSLNIPRAASASPQREPQNIEATGVPSGSVMASSPSLKPIQGLATMESPIMLQPENGPGNFSGDAFWISSTHDIDMERELKLQSQKQNEDFSALEQYIEDLTREKFSLQRSIEASKSLAESLAAENSSLTESYNQQASVVNQLKSEMEQLQEEIKSQLGELESLKMQYTNAQLECSAADERAKLLAAEVITLEEKTLRLRSNELKLEKELEKYSVELTSSKKKLSSLEKDRRDLQQTIDALQEEKKLLQSKLRKASTVGSPDGNKGYSKKHVSTSTDDLGTEVAALVPGDNADSTPSTSNIEGNDMKLIHSSDADISNRPFHFEMSTMVIPPDQTRLIQNINSLIAELTAEKEELTRALMAEISTSSTLKDINKELSRKLEVQTQRLELLTAQSMANENAPARQPTDARIIQDTASYADEGDEVVERVLGWIMKLFPGGPSRRRTSKLL